ncbi:MAG: hypothetical protein FJW40_16090 [Acidobacteria bacterium]|nr:hypothetical protein [Acidobacteriota bacterium]
MRIPILIAGATLLASCGGNTPAPPPEPPKITVADGTEIKARTTTALSTKSSEAGSSFVAHLAEPLIVGSQVVAAKGAEVEGRVVESNPGGKVKGRARIGVELVSLTPGPGRPKVAIKTNTATFEARGEKKKDATKIGLGAGIGAAVGALAGGGKGAAIGAAAGGGAGTGLVLATRDSASVIPAETVIAFKLAQPVTVTGELPAPEKK